MNYYILNNVFFASLKLITRWRPGTCLAGDVGDDSSNRNCELIQAIPFYDDIVTVPSICDTVVKTQKRVQEIVVQIRRYLFG